MKEDMKDCFFYTESRLFEIQLLLKKNNKQTNKQKRQ